MLSLESYGISTKKVICYSIPFTFSYYIIVCSGSLIQSLLSKYGLEKADYLLSINDLYKAYINTTELFYLMPSIVFFVSSIFCYNRLNGFLLLAITSSIALTLNDVIIGFNTHSITWTYFFINAFYNIIGSLIIGFFSVLLLSLIFYLNVNRGMPLAISCIIPIFFSLMLSVMAFFVIYLIYSGEPVYVSVKLKNSFDILYDSKKDSDELFGFMEGRDVKGPLHFYLTDGGKVSFKNKDSIFDANVFSISDCDIQKIKKDQIERYANMSKSSQIKNISRFELNPAFIVDGYVYADDSYIDNSDGVGLFLTKENKLFKMTSIIKNEFNYSSVSGSVLFLYNILPYVHDSIQNHFSYLINVGKRKITLENNILGAVGGKGRKGSLKCEIIPFDVNKKMRIINGKLSTGLAVLLTPKKTLGWTYDSKINLTSSAHGFINLDKFYAKDNMAYEDIAPGDITRVHGTGFSEMYVNSRHYQLSNGDNVTINGDGLRAFPTEGQGINIHGMGSFISVNGKVLNKRKIAYINETMKSFLMPISSIIKWFLSGAIILSVGKFLCFYFLKNETENIYLL